LQFKIRNERPALLGRLKIRISAISIVKLIHYIYILIQLASTKKMPRLQTKTITSKNYALYCINWESRKYLLTYVVATLKWEFDSYEVRTKMQILYKCFVQLKVSS
jgi:hypothetical protein